MKVILEREDGGTWRVRVNGDRRHRNVQHVVNKVDRADVRDAALDLIQGVKQDAGLDPTSPGVV